MKNFMSFTLAGIIGGLVVWGGLQLNNTNNQITYKDHNAQYVNLKNVRPTAYVANFTGAAQKAMPTVVHIKASQTKTSANNSNQRQSPFGGLFGDDFFFGGPQGAQQGTGSGVIISDDGYIVTNNHVIDFADEFEVTTYDNRKFKATLVGKDRKTDLAVIKIEATNLPTLEYGNSDNAQVGEWVLAVGNPFDLTSTVTAGIISAKGRNLDKYDRTKIESFIQTDAAVNPGNSGGALIDDKGRLLGINTAIATTTGSFSGYSFAIPVNMMRKIVNDLIEYGSYQRAFLGISISEMDDELSKELGVDIAQGVFVQEVMDGGAASYAGILPRDIIIGIDNKTIKNIPELQEAIGSSKVGNTISLKINRKGSLKEIPVKLKAEK